MFTIDSLIRLSFDIVIMKKNFLEISIYKTQIYQFSRNTQSFVLESFYLDN